MANNYMTVETTNLEGCVCYSLQSTVDIQNGAIVGKGELVAGERQIYTALDDYSDGMFLVANPAWDYDTSRSTNQNEENFINKAGIPFKVYKLKKDKKYTISNLPSTTTINEGDYLEFKNGVYSVASAATNLKVEKIDDTGYPFFVGSEGLQNADPSLGYTLGTTNKKYIIRVV